MTTTLAAPAARNLSTLNTYLEAAADPINMAGLLDVLGYQPGEFTSINYHLFTKFRGEPVSPEALVRRVDEMPTRDVWFGVNPIRDGILRGRGGTADVTRLAAAYADLDIKPDGCRDIEHAAAIVHEVAAAVGTNPTAVTFSGGGLQPFWPIAHGHITNEEQRAGAVAFLKRFGLLVTAIAGEAIGPEMGPAKVDAVFDLARILRAPGTSNRKYGEAIPVTCFRVHGAVPLIVDDVWRRMDELGVPTVSTTTARGARAAYANGDSDFEPRWAYADCSYALAAVEGWEMNDYPHSGRHPWHRDRAVRLAAMAAYGCFTADGYADARWALDMRYACFCDSGGGGKPREPDWDAVKRNHERAERIVAAKSPEELAEDELGGHTHYSGMTGPLFAGAEPRVSSHGTFTGAGFSNHGRFFGGVL